MTDFQDFLRHQYVYVATGEFKPGKFEEAKQLYEQAVSMYTKGFQKAYLLQQPGTDKGIAIIFWENIGDMEANHSEAYQDILKKISHLFAHTPTTSYYELVCEIEAALDQQISVQ